MHQISIVVVVVTAIAGFICGRLAKMLLALDRQQDALFDLCEMLAHDVLSLENEIASRNLQIAEIGSEALFHTALSDEHVDWFKAELPELNDEWVLKTFFVSGDKVHSYLASAYSNRPILVNSYNFASMASALGRPFIAKSDGKASKLRVDDSQSGWERFSKEFSRKPTTQQAEAILGSPDPRLAFAIRHAYDEYA